MDAPPFRPRRQSAPRTREYDPADPAWKSVELIQRGRMILDVAATDLEVSEAVHGAFHPTSWHFRQALDDAKRAWDRLRAEFGGRAMEAALDGAPVAVLTLGETGPHRPITLIPIGGKTYRAERIAGTELAPVQWRLTQFPKHDDGPYYACRLHDRTTQCDCAHWIYEIAETNRTDTCKHLNALASLGWI